jgi:hypothetical protein
MKIEDYENPADPYAPRPKASQTVAALHRAAGPGRPTHDTQPITPLARPTRQYLPFGIGALVLIALMIGMTSWQLARKPVALQITPAATAPAQVLQTASVSSPAPTSEATALPRTISAYAAPNGTLLGPIELDRMIVPVAHYGSTWIQADVEGSGLIWLRAGDVPDLAVTGPDLAPVAVQPPQTGRGPNVNAWTPPEATSAPAVEPTVAPTPTIVWATVGPVTPADFDKPDIRGTCQFVGCLGQNAVDLARAQACHALYWQYKDVDSETIPEPDLSAVRGCIWEGLYR